MKYMRVLFVCGCCLWCGLAFGVSAFVQSAYSAPTGLLQVSHPDKVARGDAFAVTATSSLPVSTMTFTWLTRKFTVPASTDNAQGKYTVTLLLPVPIDAKETHMALGVQAAGALPIQQNIMLFDKERPVQKLTVDRKFTSPPAHEKERIARDRRRVAEAVSRFSVGKAWNMPLLRPVAGSVSSQFGMRRVYNGVTKSIHRGLDMRSPMGTPVLAVADGEIILADLLYYSGNAVYIDHGLGLITSYMHMSEVNVQPGQKVRRGEAIGKVGSTGQSTGPHLHLGLVVQGTAVDPVPFLQATAISKN